MEICLNKQKSMYYNHIIMEVLDTLYVCGWLSVSDGGMWRIGEEENIAIKILHMNSYTCKLAGQEHCVWIEVRKSYHGRALELFNTFSLDFDVGLHACLYVTVAA